MENLFYLYEPSWVSSWDAVIWRNFSLLGFGFMVFVFGGSKCGFSSALPHYHSRPSRGTRPCEFEGFPVFWVRIDYSQQVWAPGPVLYFLISQNACKHWARILLNSRGPCRPGTPVAHFLPCPMNFGATNLWSLLFHPSLGPSESCQLSCVLYDPSLLPTYRLCRGEGTGSGWRLSP